MNHDAETFAQYPQNEADAGSVVRSVDIVDGFGRAETLVAELESAGVVLSIVDDGLAFDAPVGVITDELLGRMRAEREWLVLVVAGRDQGDGVGSVDPVTTIRCPWCAGIELDEDPEGLRCVGCDRLAWVLTDDGALARCDVEELGIELVDPDSVPDCASCGRWCDVITSSDAWKCSRCEPEVDVQRRRLLRWLGDVKRLRERALRADR